MDDKLELVEDPAELLFAILNQKAKEVREHADKNNLSYYSQVFNIGSFYNLKLDIILTHEES